MEDIPELIETKVFDAEYQYTKGSSSTKGWQTKTNFGKSTLGGDKEILDLTLTLTLTLTGWQINLSKRQREATEDSSIHAAFPDPKPGPFAPSRAECGDDRDGRGGACQAFAGSGQADDANLCRSRAGPKPP